MTAVTVVIPMHDAGATIGETLASVRAQEGVAWRAVVVDDRSSDGGPSVVSELASRDGRIGLVANAGVGVSAARNTGVSRCVSPFVMFLDSDDALEPGALAALVRAGSAQGFEGAAGWGTYADAGLVPAWTRRRAGGVVGLEGLVRSGGFMTGSWLVRTGAARRVPFDVSLDAAQDSDVLLRLGELGVRWASVERPVMRYRIRPGSVSKRPLRQFDRMAGVWRSFFARRRASGVGRLRAGLLTDAALSARLRALALSCGTRSALLDAGSWDEASALVRSHAGSGRPLDAGSAAELSLESWLLCFGERPEGGAGPLGAWWRRLEGEGVTERGAAAAVPGLLAALCVDDDAVLEAYAARLVSHAGAGGGVELVGLGNRGRRLLGVLLAAGVTPGLRDDGLAGDEIGGIAVGPVDGRVAPGTLVAVTPAADGPLLGRVVGGETLRWCEVAGAIAGRRRAA